MLHLHHPGAALAFHKQIHSHDGQLSATFGTEVDDHATVADSYGIYEQIIAGASVTHDVFGIELYVSDADGAGVDLSALMTIGLDPTALGSYTDFIQHIAVGNSGGYVDGAQIGSAGHRYYFPCSIKAGTQIGAKVQCTGTTGATWNTYMRLHCAPVCPELIFQGNGYVTYGADTVNTAGTAVTPGASGAEGAWTEIATTTADHWYFQAGMLISDTTGALNNYFVDLAVGDVTNKRIIFENMLCSYSGNEAFSQYLMNPWRCFARTKSGEKLYVRITCSGTADTNVSAIVYAAK